MFGDEEYTVYPTHSITCGAFSGYSSLSHVQRGKDDGCKCMYVLFNAKHYRYNGTKTALNMKINDL